MGKSVLTEVEMLGCLRAERIAKEPLATGITEIETHAHGAFVEQLCTVTIIESLQQFLHLLEMVGLVAAIAAATPLARFPLIFHRCENLDLNHMSHVRLRINRAFANVARVVKHYHLREAAGRGRGGSSFRSAFEHIRPTTLSLPASCGEGK
jgi:hypothetical protein